jgi:hypothetical protein
MRSGPARPAAQPQQQQNAEPPFDDQQHLNTDDIPF